MRKTPDLATLLPAMDCQECRQVVGQVAPEYIAKNERPQKDMKYRQYKNSLSKRPFASANQLPYKRANNQT
jgi:hypothetical protein